MKFDTSSLAQRSWACTLRHGIASIISDCVKTQCKLVIANRIWENIIIVN